MRQNKDKIITDLAKENCKLRKNFADIAMSLAEIERLYLELYQEYLSTIKHLTNKRKGVKINKKK
jgi:hypothetical protein